MRPCIGRAGVALATAKTGVRLRHAYAHSVSTLTWFEGVAFLLRWSTAAVMGHIALSLPAHFRYGGTGLGGKEVSEGMFGRVSCFTMWHEHAA